MVSCHARVRLELGQLGDEQVVELLAGRRHLVQLINRALVDVGQAGDARLDQDVGHHAEAELVEGVTQLPDPLGLRLAQRRERIGCGG